MEGVAAVTDTLVVSETFGPTIQGEGPSAGRQASFIRLGGCNLHCGWCDSSYTWDGCRFDLRTELGRRHVDDLISEVTGYGTPIVVVTGGEPLLHQNQPAWRRLLSGLAAAGFEIEVETNGTLAPTGFTAATVHRFNVSPKLAHAGDPEAARIRPAALSALTATGRAVFKFVCASPADLEEATRVAALAGIPPRLVWIMPEGTGAETLTTRLRELAGPAVAAGFNLTTRLHVLAWGDERGR